MNKKEIVRALAKRQQLTQKAAGATLNDLLEIVTEALKSGYRVKLTGFGSFSVVATTRTKSGYRIKFKAHKHLYQEIFDFLVDDEMEIKMTRADAYELLEAITNG